jgi:tetrahydromethanopterin S-methyltransferase subunit G
VEKHNQGVTMDERLFVPIGLFFGAVSGLLIAAILMELWQFLG